MAVPVTGAGTPAGAAPEPDERVAILMVDDQPENLIALEAMLEPLGQVLVAARSGRDALRALLTMDPAVVLLDVKMPGMDGFETAALIRARERSRDTPIIFLTAADRDPALVTRGYAVGAVDYLLKPVVPEFVRSKVSVFVDLARRTRQLERQAVVLRDNERAARALAEHRAMLVADLEQKNAELETFSYAVSHDLRAPLRRIEGFAKALLESAPERLLEREQRFLGNIRDATQHMSELIDDMLALAQVTRADIRWQPVDLSGLARHVLQKLADGEPARRVEWAIRPGLEATGDARLLRIVLENLLDNAWKFTRGREPARIEFGVESAHRDPAFFVRDNGAGFDPELAHRLFKPFQRLHGGSAFSGTGVGLATVQRIVQRHGGRAWAEGTVDRGAVFYFALGAPPAAAPEAIEAALARA